MFTFTVVFCLYSCANTFIAYHHWACVIASYDISFITCCWSIKVRHYLYY